MPGKATNTSGLAPATKVPYRGTVFPLPADIRSELEAVTKVSLAHVRVHADDEADAIANSHGTRAVAIGADIYVADGHVDFESREGRALIAHEVAHVVQASAAGSARTEANTTIDAAEGDADRLATDFGERGTSARWQPGAAVASGTAMQAPPAGAAPREASRQPMDAPNYFSLYESQFFDAIRERLQTVALPAPHDRLQWISGSAALAAAFQPAFKAAFGFMNLGKKLPGVLYPMDPFEIIDLHRTLTSGQPGAKLDGKLPEGPAEWSVVAGRAIAIEFEGAVRAALPRMGLRYVAQADEGNGNVTFDMLVTSHPVDLVVGRMLCDPKVVRYVAESGKRTKRQMAGRDTSRPDAFRDGIRLVFTEWQGDRDPRLWNYVKVEPYDARPEEVAASLYEQLDGKRHTELAYALVAAPPFYRVPPQWARQFPHAKQYAPEKDEADPASALDLADSALGDEAARAQAGKPVAHVDRATLAHGFATARTQLQLIGELTGPWNLFHHVGPALRWVTKHAETINAAPDKTLAIWAAIVAGQSRTLTEATGEIMEVLQLADARGVRSDTPEAKPFRDVLEAFATAMGESHMQQTAAAQLAVAKQKKALLPVVLLDRTLRTNRESAEDIAALGAPPGRPKNAGEVAKASNQNLEADALDLRAKLVGGGTVDDAQLETLTVAAAEETLANRLMALDSRSEQLLGGIKQVASPADIELTFVFPTKLREIQSTAHSMLETMRLAAHPKSIPADAGEAQKAFALSRKKAVADTQRWLGELEHREDTRLLFQRIADKVEDARVRQMIADVALLIGISIVGAMAGAWVGGLVRGTMLSGAAVDSLAFAQVAARARTVGTIANIATDASVSAGLQTAAFGGNTKLTFVENILANVMTLGALRPIHRYAEVLGALDKEAIGMWKVSSYVRVAFVHTGTFTTEMLVGAGAGYVAARIAHGEQPKDDAQATSWALQGAALAVGHFISRRMGGIQKRLEQLGEVGAHLRDRAKTQTDLATKLTHEKTPSTEEALHLLEEHSRLLQEEAALLRDDKALARMKLDAHQVETLRAGNDAATADTHSQAFDVMKLRFLGLEPLSSNGLVWSGTRAQIELVLADGKGAVRNIVPEADGRWTGEMGGQRVTFVVNERGREVDRTPPTKEQAEANRTMAKQAIKVNEARSQQVTALFEGMDAPKVKHATIGEGVAATMSHASQTHGHGVAPGEIKELPEALAIAENPDWWQILGDRDIGQPVTDYFSKGYRWQPGEFNADHKNRGRASDVAYANAMTSLETGMATLRGLVTEVQQFTGSEVWPVAAKWRIQINGGKWLYTDSVAFAGGLGAPKRSAAISKSLEQQLIDTKRMTYAQQALLPPAPDGATIIVIGDSGTAGWAAQEAIRTGRKAIIIARDASLSKVPPHVRNDLSAHGVPIVTGEVKSAALEGDSIVLTMKSAVEGEPSKTVRGDAVSMAIGQEQVLPRGFEDLHFRAVTRSHKGKERVVGLEAFDPTTGDRTGLLVQGAQMTTPAFKFGPKPVVENRKEFVEALARQANDPDVPELSRGVEPSIHQSAVNVPLSNKRNQE